MGIFSKKNKTDYVSDDPKVLRDMQETQRLMRDVRDREVVSKPYPSLYDPDAPERVDTILKAEEKSPLVLVKQSEPVVNQESKWNKDKKRLVVLLLAAAWIVIAGFVSYGDYEPYLENAIGHAVLQFFVCSLPATLFGGILFWWFGKERM